MQEARPKLIPDPQIANTIYQCTSPSFPHRRSCSFLLHFLFKSTVSCALVFLVPYRNCHRVSNWSASTTGLLSRSHRKIHPRISRDPRKRHRDCFSIIGTRQSLHDHLLAGQKRVADELARPQGNRSVGHDEGDFF